MKIALLQYNYQVGNIAGNTEQIVKGITMAKHAGAKLAVFSELCVSGYPPKDLLLLHGFVKSCEQGVMTVAKHCRGIAAVIGSPSLNPSSKGRYFFNSAFLLTEGKIVAKVNKTLLPFYDVFDEFRYFEPGHEVEPVKFGGVTFALTICEDIWNEIPSTGNHYPHTWSPLAKLVTNKTDCIINISASPFSYIHPGERKQLFKFITKKYKVPLVYVNTLGANTDLVFDGGSMVVNSDSRVISELQYFKKDMHIVELEKKQIKAVKLSGESAETTIIHRRSSTQNIHDALILGIEDYFHKSNIPGKAIVGVSGGIDSAVVLVLAIKALGKDNVFALMLPSQYNSSQSLKDAEELIKIAGCKTFSLSIEPAVEEINKTLSPLFKGMKSDVTEENIQSRIRALLIMAVSNKSGYLMLNTSNKSELATGYGTLYGDMGGALSVIGDLYKTAVYKLAGYLNFLQPGVIPDTILKKVPSAELKHGQKDTDTLPEFDILDKVLFQYMKLHKTAAEIKVKGASAASVKKILDMVNRNEYKRAQSPPVLRISPKSFGIGRRMPIVAKYP